MSFLAHCEWHGSRRPDANTPATFAWDFRGRSAEFLFPRPDSQFTSSRNCSRSFSALTQGSLSVWCRFPFWAFRWLVWFGRVRSGEFQFNDPDPWPSGCVCPSNSWKWLGSSCKFHQDRTGWFGWVVKLISASLEFKAFVCPFQLRLTLHSRWPRWAFHFGWPPSPFPPWSSSPTPRFWHTTSRSASANGRAHSTLFSSSRAQCPAAFSSPLFIHADKRRCSSSTEKKFRLTAITPKASSFIVKINLPNSAGGAASLEC